MLRVICQLAYIPSLYTLFSLVTAGLCVDPRLANRAVDTEVLLPLGSAASHQLIVLCENSQAMNAGSDNFLPAVEILFRTKFYSAEVTQQTRERIDGALEEAFGKPGLRLPRYVDDFAAEFQEFVLSVLQSPGKFFKHGGGDAMLASLVQLQRYADKLRSLEAPEASEE